MNVRVSNNENKKNKKTDEEMLKTLKLILLLPFRSQQIYTIMYRYNNNNNQCAVVHYICVYITMVIARLATQNNLLVVLRTAAIE